MSADGSIPAARTTAATSQWFTPPALVEPARRFLNTIDLDPTSCEVANRTVQAVAYYDAADDGLALSWYVAGGVFINPPSPPRPWWRKMRDEIEAGHVTRAVFVGYSIEVLQQFQDDAEWLRRWHVCVPAKRVRYLTTAGDRLATVHRRTLKALDAYEDAKGRIATADVDPAQVEKLRRAFEASLAETDRLAALDPNALMSGDAPAHASVVLGYGDAAAGRLEWRAAFGDVGVCW